MSFAPIRRPGRGNRRPLRPLIDRAALDAAKQRVTIYAAWPAMGLPGEPRPSCRSPFREERNPSFSITADGLLWHDFADGSGGDVVSFVKRATGCGDAEAIRRVLDLAVGGTSLAPFLLAPLHGPAAPARPVYDGIAGLELRLPSVAELAGLAELRAWPVFAGLELAVRRGLLRVANVPHRGDVFAAWILTDDALRSAQARRLDGEGWQGDGYTFKSKSLRTNAEHPPGLADVVNADRSVVLLTEGEPDALAVLTFAWIAGCVEHVGVIALTGASKALPLAVLEKLRGRCVRIVRQTDTAGHQCALSWSSCLEAAGVACDLVNLDGLHRADGAAAKDAADLLRYPAELENLEPLAVALFAGLVL